MVSALNTVMIKGPLTEEGWGGEEGEGEGGGEWELSRGATVVRRSVGEESLSAFICHFLLLSWLH